ncbi:MAG TPA: chorismate mutase [Candidatus Syntrophoarchaeum butanivorans]|uniref:Chorismate mutase n=1 Tax=Candidatus Syntropharchaeum butanivorans TaxID=1839936 RepID=A0A1F2P4V2_9EURY|nr:MAG: Chorismate mutase domain protein [Candidatus Syntrophoarchaeum butanivorans]RJS70783.1 MAG: chorismate mutase [Candidatus Syntrophoarchaeum sp. WYZ-LMO15]HDM36375.1 chorismate mutase [Candidatus Syntrophoarchaeum butanivorans]HEC56842.1 chorismate mutase [Candidatus Syntrophoarchaeum butanivorans]
MELSAVREKIRMIDEKIAELIKERTQLAVDVFNAKRDKNIDIIDNQQIEEVLKRAEAFAVSNGLNPEPVRQIFRILIDMNIEEQQRLMEKEG